MTMISGLPSFARHCSATLTPTLTIIVPLTLTLILTFAQTLGIVIDCQAASFSYSIDEMEWCHAKP